MSEVKWIKIVTDIFDDEKILLIESLPDCDSILVIWLKMLCLAGKQNNGGVFVMSNGIPYTDEMLSIIFRRKKATVKMALQTFESFGMIEIINNAVTIPNWDKHQSLDAYEKKKEYDRLYRAKQREKQKALVAHAEKESYDQSYDVVSKIRTEEDKDKELDINNTSDRSVIDSVMKKWNDIEGITKIYEIRRGSTREKHLLTRLKEDGLSGVFKAMNMIAESDFLMGKTSDWKVTFDWFIRPSNFTKVIEGNYKNADKKKKTIAPSPNSIRDIPGDKAREHMERMKRLAREMEDDV